MRILITGHRGYIGSRLFEALKKQGHDVFGIDKKPTDWNEVVHDGRNINSMRDFPEDIDVVYHLAAQAGVPESWDDPIQDAKDNILATLNIIKQYPVSQIIFTTTGAAVGAPESPYGLSKATCEQYIKMLHSNYLIIRLSSVFGEKPKGVVDNFIRDKEITVYGDGSHVRDFVHVDDVVKGLIVAQERGILEHTYQMGSGEGVKVIDLAKATGKAIKFLPERKGDKGKVVLENNLRHAWLPKIDVIEYIKEKCKT